MASDRRAGARDWHAHGATVDVEAALDRRVADLARFGWTVAKDERGTDAWGARIAYLLLRSPDRGADRVLTLHVCTRERCDYRAAAG